MINFRQSSRLREPFNSVARVIVWRSRPRPDADPFGDNVMRRPVGLAFVGAMAFIGIGWPISHMSTQLVLSAQSTWSKNPPSRSQDATGQLNDDLVEPCLITDVRAVSSVRSAGKNSLTSDGRHLTGPAAGTINQSQKILRRALLEDGYTRMKLDILSSGYWALTGAINGRAVCLAIDTGASVTHLDPDRTGRFRLSWSHGVQKKKGSPTFDWHEATLDSLDVGPFHTSRLRVFAHDFSETNRKLNVFGDPPIDGVIGQDVLKKAQAVFFCGSDEIFLRPGP